MDGGQLVACPVPPRPLVDLDSPSPPVLTAGPTGRAVHLPTRSAGRPSLPLADQTNWSPVRQPRRPRPPGLESSPAGRYPGPYRPSPPQDLLKSSGPAVLDQLVARAVLSRSADRPSRRSDQLAALPSPPLSPTGLPRPGQLVAIPSAPRPAGRPSPPSRARPSPPVLMAGPTGCLTLCSPTAGPHQLVSNLDRPADQLVANVTSPVLP